MKKTVLTIALAVFACAARAETLLENRLVSVNEWKQICQAFNAPENISLCQVRLHRAVAAGRSLGTFELINPEQQDLLQSRSGVFFSKELNPMIIALREDTGLRTQMELQENARCQSYAAAPDLVGMPFAGRRYGKLINSWLREYTDAEFQLRAVELGRQNGMEILRFEALADDGKLIQGQYAFDAQANAGIFSTCDHPVGTAQARKNVEQFFRAIVGSARKFS